MATCCSKKIETTANLVRNYLKSPISLLKGRLPASRINSGILPPKRWMLEFRLELRSPDLKAPTRNEVQWNQCLGIRRSRHIASCINHIPSHARDLGTWFWRATAAPPELCSWGSGSYFNMYCAPNAWFLLIRLISLIWFSRRCGLSARSRAIDVTVKIYIRWICVIIYSV